MGDMTEGAIKEIRALTEQAMASREIGGVTYIPIGFVMVKEPLAESLKVQTLQSMADYLNKDVDGLAHENMLIHVNDANQVKLMSHLFDETRQREALLTANAPYSPFVFGAWHTQEEFIIGLQTVFVQDDNINQLINMANTVTDEAVKVSDDDGITQRVTARVGIQRVENVEVKGRYKLQPHRTFMEVEQPASEFVFRIKSAAAQGPPGFALFEADSSAWKVEAISRVAAWLKAETEKEITILA